MIDVIPIIKDRMKMKGLNNKELAEKIDISYPNLIKILNNKSGMNLSTFLRIVDVLEIKLFAEQNDISLSELSERMKNIEEDNKNLKMLTQFLRKENDELKARLGE